MKIIHKGIVVNGRIEYDRPNIYIEKVNSLEGERVDVIIEKEKKFKTNSQLGYYFGGIIETCLVTNAFEGWTKDEIDKYFRKKHLRYDRFFVHPITQKEYYTTFYRQLEDLSVDEMKKFIDDVLNEIAEMEIYPLTPDEYYIQVKQTCYAHRKRRATSVLGTRMQRDVQQKDVYPDLYFFGVENE
jgi:hypothetical protein